MNRQEEYEKVKSDCWGTCVFEGRLTKELVEEVFDTAYNLGKKHAMEDRVEALNLKGLDQASVIERGLTYLEENGKPLCVCYEGESKIRLQVATAAMKGILANTNIIMSCGCLEDNQEYITKHAVMYADALIEEINGKND